MRLRTGKTFKPPLSPFKGANFCQFYFWRFQQKKVGEGDAKASLYLVWIYSILSYQILHCAYCTLKSPHIPYSTRAEAMFCLKIPFISLLFLSHTVLYVQCVVDTLAKSIFIPKQKKSWLAWHEGAHTGLELRGALPHPLSL